MTATLLRIEIDGHPVNPAETPDPAGLQVGHFTAIQVRNRRARGIALHLRRLDAATRELFGIGLDGNLVRDRIRHALGDDADASVRVYVVPNDGGSTPSMLVTVKPPADFPPNRCVSCPWPTSDPWHISSSSATPGSEKPSASPSTGASTTRSSWIRTG